MWFFGMAFAFAILYWQCGGGWIDNLHTIEVKTSSEPSAGYKQINLSNGQLFVRSLYFSIVTMTTLGFGDMYAKPTSLMGHLLLCIQVLLGYIMLAVLVTRISIMFSSEGPGSTMKTSSCMMAYVNITLDHLASHLMKYGFVQWLTKGATNR